MCYDSGVASITFRITKEQQEKLFALCEITGVSLSVYLRRGLTYILKQNEEILAQPIKYDRIIDSNPVED